MKSKFLVQEHLQNFQRLHILHVPIISSRNERFASNLVSDFFNGNFQLCECTQTLLSGQIYSIILKGSSSKKNAEPNHLKTSLKNDFVRL